MHLQNHTGVAVSEDAVLFAYRQETSREKRERGIFPLVDQLKLQRRKHTDPIVGRCARMEELHIPHIHCFHPAPSQPTSYPNFQEPMNPATITRHNIQRVESSSHRGFS
ncbi:hypothetical protein SETIT_3G177200v2 [Setaria italica]|uniref:Uncharacterized protein n=1 Tax=Setaria italica TaxID=4555 RepID=A0A368QG87_SETIT|nr:hypothetical protein SETIT_3G177200v2 [Setaria italica]